MRVFFDEESELEYVELDEPGQDVKDPMDEGLNMTEGFDERDSGRSHHKKVVEDISDWELVGDRV